MFRRRQVKTHRRLMRDELGQSYEHFLLAATHAAGGARGIVTPRVTAAKRSVQPGLRKASGATAATAMPVALAARTGWLAGRSRVPGTRPRGRRWPMMLGGLLAAGAAVGAAGALVARRRAGNTQWEEYGTSRSTASPTDMLESAESVSDSGREQVQSLAEAAKDRAADMMGDGGASTNRSPSPSPGPSPSPSSGP